MKLQASSCSGRIPVVNFRRACKSTGWRSDSARETRATGFYQHYGIQSSPLPPMTLMLRLNSGKP
jgi:tRNA(Phe) wybutosine-synthesizing methylase Tyw3